MGLKKPKIILRKEWDALPPERNNANYFLYSRDIREVYYSIVLHHSADLANLVQDPKAIIRGIQEEHMRRGYGDIGYHYVIDRQGNVYQGRLLPVRGCHVYRGNTGRMGICVLGNYEAQELKESQQDALVELVAWWAQYLHITSDQILGHCDLNATACPGIHIRSFLPLLKKAVKNKVNI